MRHPDKRHPGWYILGTDPAARDLDMARNSVIMAKAELVRGGLLRETVPGQRHVGYSRVELVCAS